MASWKLRVRKCDCSVYPKESSGNFSFTVPIGFRSTSGCKCMRLSRRGYLSQSSYGVADVHDTQGIFIALSVRMSITEIATINLATNVAGSAVPVSVMRCRDLLWESLMRRFPSRYFYSNRSNKQKASTVWKQYNLIRKFRTCPMYAVLGYVKRTTDIPSLWAP